MSKQIISNTVKFAFPLGAPRPSWIEIAGFVTTLDSDPKSMDTVYKMESDRSLCIKYKSEDAMQAVLQKHRDGINFVYSSGKSVEVRMFMAGIHLQYVRVFDVPPEVEDKELIAALENYGKIHRMLREKFPTGLGLDHLYSGVRGVYMEISSDIPPAVYVAEWKANIFYDGLKGKCFSCQLEGHQKNSCPLGKATKKREQSKNLKSTYAGVVEAGATAVSTRMDSIDDGDIIEIVEEEIEPQDHTEEEERVESPPRTTSYIDQFDKERVEEIDRAAEQLGLPNFTENIAKLSSMIEALPNSNGKDRASERRAQFAASGSTELRPKKSARKSNK